MLVLHLPKPFQRRIQELKKTSRSIARSWLGVANVAGLLPHSFGRVFSGFFSVQQVEGIVSIIDEVNASAVRTHSQAEQGAPAGAAGIDCLRGKLRAGGCRFDEVPIPSVHGEDILVRRDRKTKWLIQASPRGDGRALPRTGEAKHGIGNGSDPTIQRVRNVERSIVR